MNKGLSMHVSLNDEWETPQWLFDALNAEFGFTLDGAATEKNKKCKYFGVTAWENERVFCNPPYSSIQPFVEQAFKARLCVLLLPVLTDNSWWRILIERDVPLRYFRKRIRFLLNGKRGKNPPRFTSVVAIVKGI